MSPVGTTPIRNRKKKKNVKYSVHQETIYFYDKSINKIVFFAFFYGWEPDKPM